MNRIKQLCGGQYRPLLLSFLLTLLGCCFALTLLWVQIQAARGNFFGWDKPPAELVTNPRPHLVLRVEATERVIPLEWLDDAAGIYQKLERWIIPPELRFADRAKRLTQNLAEKAEYQRREQEFYKNAGAV